MTTVCTTQTTDIYMDAESTLYVTINCETPEGLPRELDGSSITWVAFSPDGIQRIKKTTASTTILLSAEPSTYITTAANAGQNYVIVNKVTAFGVDSYNRAISNFAEGDIVRLTNPNGNTEKLTISSIDTGAKKLTFTTNLRFSYSTGATYTCKRISSGFDILILPGDVTIPPGIKHYARISVWHHMALATWTSSLSPGNIYQAPTTLVAARGRLFLQPVLPTAQIIHEG